MYYVHSNVCLSVKLVPVFQSIGTLVPFGIPAESGRNVPPSRLGRPPNFHNKLHHNKIPLRPHIGTTSLRHHALLIAQLGINTGGLSILDLRSRTIPDFMISFTSALRHATSSIYLNKHLHTVPLHSTISDLFSLPTNHNSLILQRYHHLLPQIAQIAFPPTTE